MFFRLVNTHTHMKMREKESEEGGCLIFQISLYVVRIWQIPVFGLKEWDFRNGYVSWSISSDLRLSPLSSTWPCVWLEDDIYTHVHINTIGQQKQFNWSIFYRLEILEIVSYLQVIMVWLFLCVIERRPWWLSSR